jgi:voltage-gated potassium channel
MMKQWSQQKKLIARRGIVYSLIMCLLIIVLGGLGFWLLDPEIHTFSDGLWLAFTPAATVGYGDLVPSTQFSRVFAVLVVLMGLGVISLVTASVAAMFVETEERQIERDLMRELGALRAQVEALHAEVKAQHATPPATQDRA